MGTPLLKMCGMVSPEDAELAAAAGADFIGMIMWPKAKRAVQRSVARAIATAARRHNAKVCMLMRRTGSTSRLCRAVSQ